MMNPAILLYTHTDYKDVWPLFFGQADLYLKDYKKFVLVNEHDDDIPEEYEQIHYNEDLTYNLRVYSALSNIEDQQVLFLHEDMVLFDEPNYKVIQDYASLVSEKKADFVKLIKAGSEPFTKSVLHENLVYAPNSLLFSIQPTICEVSKLKNVYLLTPGSNIWDFETRASDTCAQLGYNNCFMSSDESEKKRGGAHWDSTIFPYIATAIVKGKWNYSEYTKELDTLLSKYKIDKNIRGIR